MFTTTARGNSFTVFSVRKPALRRIANVTLRRAQLDDPEFVSVARDGSVYFASITSGMVGRFSASSLGDAKPVETQDVQRPFGGGESAIGGFAGDAHGTVYFSGPAQDAVEIIDSRGRSGSLHGPHTGLSRPHGIAVDANDLLYVANAGNDSVTIYASAARRDARPARVITGARTSLKEPQAIAVDNDGTTYVFGGPAEYTGSAYPRQYVAVFAPGSSGNVLPRRVYSVRAGCFTNDHI
jgi:serine/threonine-protein kinase